MKLLNPGPVSLTPRVRRALAEAPDVCHREPEFAELAARVRDRINAVYGTSAFAAVLLGGSGTSAVESMLSLVAQSENALVIANGVYGERVSAMLRAQNKPHEVVATPSWTAPIDVAAIDRALATRKFGHAIVVHHETTTGRLNPIAEIGALCTKYATPMLIDSVSSFGGEEILFDEWNVEGAAGTANKCLHGAPGVSFVVARETALARPSGATSVYLDLHKHAADQKKGSAPFTLPTHVMYTLDEALAEHHDEGGWQKRRATYRARSARVRTTCQELGAALLLENEAAYGSTLTSFRIPEGRTYAALHESLKKDGFVIYAGQGKFDGAIFRIAVMGDLGRTDEDRLAASLRAALA